MNKDLEYIRKAKPEIAMSLAMETLRNEYRNSLWLTATRLLGYSEITKHTHERIINALESSSKRKLICVPRGCFKSSIGVIAYSIWRLLRDPNLRVMVDSALYTNSKNFIREIKAHLESDRLTRIFGQFKSESNWSEGSITIKQRTKPLKEPSIRAAGMGVSVVSQHFDLIIHDDMNDHDNSATQEGRQKIIDHYRMNTSILEPGGTMVVIGTRYATNDLIGWIKENEIDKKGLMVLPDHNSRGNM